MNSYCYNYREFTDEYDNVTGFAYDFDAEEFSMSAEVEASYEDAMMPSARFFENRGHQITRDRRDVSHR